MRSPYSQFVFGFFLSFWPAPLVGFATYLLLVDREPVIVEVIAPPTYGAPLQWVPTGQPPEQPAAEAEPRPDPQRAEPDYRDFETPRRAGASPHRRQPVEPRRKRDTGLPEL